MSTTCSAVKGAFALMAMADDLTDFMARSSSAASRTLETRFAFTLSMASCMFAAVLIPGRAFFRA